MALNPDDIHLGPNYRIEKIIAEGETTTVLRAKCMSLQMPVAIKILTPKEGLKDSVLLRRFQHEGKVLAIMNHLACPKILDFGITPQGHPYMIMELFEGETMETVVNRDGPLSGPRFKALFGQICDGMAYLHTQGIVHRDLKPAHFLLKKEDNGPERVRITGFRCSLSVKEKDKASVLTQMGEVVGTPLYMSPEQSLGKEVDERSDIYSLGASMFFALTGSPPFEGDSTVETLRQQIEQPPSIDRVPEEFRSTVAKALEKDPANRFQNMTDLATALGGKAELAKPEKKKWWPF